MSPTYWPLLILILDSVLLVIVPWMVRAFVRIEILELEKRLSKEYATKDELNRLSSRMDRSLARFDEELEASRGN